MIEDSAVPPQSVEAMAATVDRHADFRVLRRLPETIRSCRPAPGLRIVSGCALDVETTGLDPRRDAIVELAIQRFWATTDGWIMATGRQHSWFEDPGQPLPPTISALTGLTDADVAGRRIHDGIAACLIADADFVVAHNAAFDRPFVERRLPEAAGRPWVCTLADVDWRGLGFEGRSLPHLIMQMGFFYDAHRASADVTALIRLLDHPLAGGGTVLRSAVQTAGRSGWLIEADGAPFEARERLKARGYRWDARERVWAREVASDAFDAECAWLDDAVYHGAHRPRFRPMTWRERFALN